MAAASLSAQLPLASPVDSFCWEVVQGPCGIRVIPLTTRKGTWMSSSQLAATGISSTLERSLSGRREVGERGTGQRETVSESPAETLAGPTLLGYPTLLMLYKRVISGTLHKAVLTLLPSQLGCEFRTIMKVPLTH